MKQYSISHCLFQPGSGKYLYLVAENPQKPQSILMYNMDLKKLEQFHQSTPSILDEDYMSLPRHVKFPVDGNKAHAYGYYYPPHVR